MRVISLKLDIPAATASSDPVTVTEPVSRGTVAYVIPEFPANSHEAKIQLRLDERPILPALPRDDAVDYITFDDKALWIRVDEPVDDDRAELVLAGWNDSATTAYTVYCVVCLFEQGE